MVAGRPRMMVCQEALRTPVRIVVGTEGSWGDTSRKRNGAKRFSDRNYREENVLRCFAELLDGMRRLSQRFRETSQMKKTLGTSVLERNYSYIYRLS